MEEERAAEQEERALKAGTAQEQELPEDGQELPEDGQELPAAEAAGPNDAGQDALQPGDGGESRPEEAALSQA